MEWKDWCRLCAKENDNKVDILINNENSSKIAETVKNHFLYTIDYYDEMPTKICATCYDFILSIVYFTSNTSKVQKMFLEILEHMKCKTEINLYELRTKYEIVNISNIDKNGLLTVPKFEKEKIEYKSGYNFTADLTDINSYSNRDNFDSPNKNVIIYEEIKSEIEQDSQNMSEFNNILKTENDIVEENVTDNSKGENGVCNFSINKKIQPEIDSLNTCDNLTYETNKETTNLKTKRLSNKLYQNDITKKVKKKYREEEKRIQCEICLMKFVRENNLSAHLKKAHKLIKELPPCEYCGKLCKTKQKLKFHRELHLPKEERQKLLFKCPSCEQKFTQKGAMRSHIRGTHSHERPFICEACGKAFTSQSNLWAHRKKTHEENMMPCEICQKICKNSSSLRKHMGTHKEPSIPCSICGILLKTKKTLKNHMLVHSNIKAFQCNYCGKEFKRDITLQLHMIIHSGLKPYICRFCEQSYANPSNCKKHEKHSHPIEYQAAEGENGPSQPQRVLKKLPNIKQLTAMLEDMKAAKENS